MSSLGHTEILGILPSFLVVRKVIQVPIEALPVLQEQPENLIWSKGERKVRMGASCACPSAVFIKSPLPKRCTVRVIYVYLILTLQGHGLEAVPP